MTNKNLHLQLIELMPGKELEVLSGTSRYKRRARVVRVTRSGRTVWIELYQAKRNSWTHPVCVPVADVVRDTAGQAIA